MVKLLFDSHVALVVGTDEMAGLMLHHELALYVRGMLRSCMPLTPASNHGEDVPQRVQTKRYALDASTESASGDASFGHSAAWPPRYLSQSAAVASCDRSLSGRPWAI